MKHIPVLLVLVSLLLGSSCPPAWGETALPVLLPQVLHSVPRESSNFTQGLFFHNNMLYESTGLYGHSQVVIREPEQGTILHERNLPSALFGEGSVVAHDTLYVLTWREETCLLLDPVTLEDRAIFTYEGEGWGLTWDGTRLIRSDGSNRLRFHELDGTVTHVLDVYVGQDPLNRLNELEWDPVNKLILANIWFSNQVAAIDPQSGQVVFWLDLSSLVPEGQQDPNAVLNGLALRDKELWVTGKLWPVMYVLAWPPEQGSGEENIP